MRKCDRASELAVLSAMYRKRFRNRRGIRNLPDRYCRKSTWCFHSKFNFKRKHASKQLGTRRSPCLTILLCEITVLVRNAPIVYSFRLSGSNAKSITPLRHAFPPRSPSKVMLLYSLSSIRCYLIIIYFQSGNAFSMCRILNDMQLQKYAL